MCVFLDSTFGGFNLFALSFILSSGVADTSMLASFEYCKARCDVSLVVSCFHSLVFCNTRIICAFEGELLGAFARLAKLAPLETTTSLLLSTWPRFRSNWSTKFALSHTKKSREQDLKKKEHQRTNATGTRLVFCVVAVWFVWCNTKNNKPHNKNKQQLAGCPARTANTAWT